MMLHHKRREMIVVRPGDKVVTTPILEYEDKQLNPGKWKVSHIGNQKVNRN